MSVEINWVAVLLAGLSSMIVGGIWYGPLFGKAWRKLVGIAEKDVQKPQAKPLLIAILMSLLTAYVIAHVAYLSSSFFGSSALSASLSTAFWLWLGIAFTTIVVHDTFEQRSKKLTLINIGNRLFTIMAMGLIIGLFGF